METMDISLLCQIEKLKKENKELEKQKGNLLCQIEKLKKENKELEKQNSSKLKGKKFFYIDKDKPANNQLTKQKLKIRKKNHKIEMYNFLPLSLVGTFFKKYSTDNNLIKNATETPEMTKKKYDDLIEDIRKTKKQYDMFLTTLLFNFPEATKIILTMTNCLAKHQEKADLLVKHQEKADILVNKKPRRKVKFVLAQYQEKADLLAQHQEIIHFKDALKEYDKQKEEKHQEIINFKDELKEYYRQKEEKEIETWYEKLRTKALEKGRPQINKKFIEKIKKALLPKQNTFNSKNMNINENDKENNKITPGFGEEYIGSEEDTKIKKEENKIKPKENYVAIDSAEKNKNDDIIRNIKERGLLVHTININNKFQLNCELKKNNSKNMNINENDKENNKITPGFGEEYIGSEEDTKIKKDIDNNTNIQASLRDTYCIFNSVKK